MLSEDIQVLEGRLDDIKWICQNSSKRLLACLSGNVGSDFDKRLVRYGNLYSYQLHFILYYFYTSINNTHKHHFDGHFPGEPG